MPAPIYICHKMATVTEDAVVISTVASSNEWSDLSPFKLGPCKIHSGLISQNMENAWQFSKLYKQHAINGKPSYAYWSWAAKGWEDIKAHRYPMGKGAVPLCSIWKNKEGKLLFLKYIEARKAIYGPLYINLVKRTGSYCRLKKLMRDSKKPIYFRDWDGYDHDRMDQTLTQVINNPNKKMGHAFFLKAALTDDPVLDHLRWDLHHA